MPETRLETPLLSGAVFPDWSVVTSDNVRASLIATHRILRMTRKWCGIRPDEDRVRVAVLTQYAEAGHAPSHERVAKITGFEREEVVHLLGQLQERDIVVLNESDRAIVVAYPFTERDTGHRIRLGKKKLNAMCAIDALGAGAMVGVDSVIDSTCRQCRCAIHVETRDKGRGIKSVSPEDAIVWAGVQDVDSCLADTQCKVRIFFCSDDHLDAWHRDNPADVQGRRLAMNEGLELGMAFFLPYLVRSHQQNER